MGARFAGRRREKRGRQTERGSEREGEGETEMYEAGDEKENH